MTKRPKIADSHPKFFNFTLKFYSGTFAKYEYKDPEGAQERDWKVSLFKPSPGDTWCAHFVARDVSIDVLDKESPAAALSAVMSRLLWISNIQHQVEEY
jgi:hypothetical protein